MPPPNFDDENEGDSPRSTGDGDVEAALVRLARAGHYTPPSTNPAPWPEHPGGPRYTEAQMATLFDELTGEA